MDEDDDSIDNSRLSVGMVGEWIWSWHGQSKGMSKRKMYINPRARESLEESDVCDVPWRKSLETQLWRQACSYK